MNDGEMNEPSQTQIESIESPGPTIKPATRGITLADSAVRRIKVLMTEKPNPESGLRLAIQGGGCSGLSYIIDWADKPREKDKIYERDGARVFVDSRSHLYLAGTEISFEQTLMTSGFKLSNPNAKSSCGCGESFSV